MVDHFSHPVQVFTVETVDSMRDRLEVTASVGLTKRSDGTPGGGEDGNRTRLLSATTRALGRRETGEYNWEGGEGAGSPPWRSAKRFRELYQHSMQNDLPKEDSAKGCWEGLSPGRVCDLVSHVALPGTVCPCRCHIESPSTFIAPLELSRVLYKGFNSTVSLYARSSKQQRYSPALSHKESTDTCREMADSSCSLCQCASENPCPKVDTVVPSPAVRHSPRVSDYSAQLAFVSRHSASEFERTSAAAVRQSILSAWPNDSEFNGAERLLVERGRRTDDAGGNNGVNLHDVTSLLLKSRSRSRGSSPKMAEPSCCRRCRRRGPSERCQATASWQSSSPPEDTPSDFVRRLDEVPAAERTVAGFRLAPPLTDDRSASASLKPPWVPHVPVTSQRKRSSFRNYVSGLWDAERSSPTQQPELFHQESCPAFPLLPPSSRTLSSLTPDSRNDSTAVLLSATGRWPLVKMIDRSEREATDGKSRKSPSVREEEVSFFLPDESKIVVKRILKQKFAPVQLARCYREVEILKTLSHSNIIRLLSSVDREEELWMVFEHAKFGDLYHFTNLTTLSEMHTIRIMGQILSAIEYTHRKGLVHGDMKPHNVLLFPPVPPQFQSRRQNLGGIQDIDKDAVGEHCGGDGDDAEEALDWETVVVKICDFGLAQYVNGDGLIPFNGVLGTQNFIAPEVLRNTDYDAKIDMWAIGVIAFQLLVGYEPFFPPSASRTAPLEFDPRYWDDISDEAKDFIKKCLERDVKMRLSAEAGLVHPWFSLRT